MRTANDRDPLPMYWSDWANVPITDPTGGRFTQCTGIFEAWIDPLGLAQCDVDDMTALARELNPDMNIPTPELAPLPVMGDRAVAGQVDALPFSRPQVNSEIYGGRLTPQQRVDLYNTIVHEAWHYDKQSFLTRGLGGRFEREARREGNARANAAKARILAGGQGSCGCRVK